jgi:hypothetical protein
MRGVTRRVILTLQQTLSLSRLFFFRFQVRSLGLLSYLLVCLPLRFLSILSSYTVVYQPPPLYFLPFRYNKTKGSQLVSLFNLWSLFSLLTIRSLVPQGTPFEVDEVFLESCKDVLSAVSPIMTLVASPTAYKFAYLSLDDDEESVSDADRLSAFYPNAGYDFYGTPSGALCVYKNGQAWPVHTGPESQRIIREARSVHGHPMQYTWPKLGRSVCDLLDDKDVLWTSMDCLAFAD